MPFTSTFDFQSYINRAVAMLRANTTLINPTPANSLVTNIIAQEPAIDQSPDISLIPVINVMYPKNPFRQTEQIGRDDLDVAGAKYYHLEFYNVCIARGISKQEALKKVEAIATVVRDVFQKNLRMTDPASPGTDPLVATNNVISVPYVLRSTTPNIQAINVICRPDVPISLT